MQRVLTFAALIALTASSALVAAPNDEDKDDIHEGAVDKEKG